MLAVVHGDVARPGPRLQHRMGVCFSAGANHTGVQRARAAYASNLRTAREKTASTHLSSKARGVRLLEQCRRQNGGRPTGTLPASAIIPPRVVPSEGKSANDEKGGNTTPRLWTGCQEEASTAGGGANGGCSTCIGWPIGPGGGLFLGSVYDILDRPFIEGSRITHIVNITEMNATLALAGRSSHTQVHDAPSDAAVPSSPSYSSQSPSPSPTSCTSPSLPTVHVYQLPLDDDDGEANRLYVALPAVSGHIKEALRGGGVVLVNCEFGISRSAAVVAACVMDAAQEARPDVALEWMRARRPVVDPNIAFREALTSWGLAVANGKGTRTI